VDSPWFYCAELHVGEVVLSDAETRHVRGSRRLRAGDTLTLFDGAGQVAQGALVSDAAPSARRKRGATCARIEAVQVVPPPGRTLTLVVPGCKGARLDWLAEKCTELGVTRLVLSDFERSVVRVGPQHLDKLRRIAIEACKQCRRAWLPEIAAAGSLTAAHPACDPGALLVAHLDEAARPLGAALAGSALLGAHVVGVIGPEGGLTSTEMDYLRSRGGTLVWLGAHVLRVETAALALAACWAAQSTGLVPRAADAGPRGGIDR
jgi:16S rRNA (uracil1498-N3)-methyltransferase